MAKKLLSEVKQTRDFNSLEEEAMLNLLRSADVIRHRLECLLKPYDLSLSQYNILRILRGAPKDGLISEDIRGRLLTQVPDVPRLLSRLAEKALILRVPDSTDGRATRNQITSKGIQLLGLLDEPINEFPKTALAGTSPKELQELIAMLEKMRPCD